MFIIICPNILKIINKFVNVIMYMVLTNWHNRHRNTNKNNTNSNVNYHKDKLYVGINSSIRTYNTPDTLKINTKEIDKINSAKN